MSAFLAADYRDAGKSRAIEVLEEIRDGLIRKMQMAVVVADDAEQRDDNAAFEAAVRCVACYRTIVDDIAMFIAREQGRLN